MEPPTGIVRDLTGGDYAFTTPPIIVAIFVTPPDASEQDKAAVAF